MNGQTTNTDPNTLLEPNFKPTNNISPDAQTAHPPSPCSIPSTTSQHENAASTSTALPPTMKKPWKSSIATNNGTAVLKPSIGTTHLAWTTPSGAAGADGNGNGSVAFKGAGHSLNVPFTLYVGGMVMVLVMSAVMLGVW